MARVSTYFDCSYLSDVFYLEDVRITGTEVGPDGCRIGIRLESDQIIDEIITSMQSLQRKRQIDGLRSRLKRVEKDLGEAEALRDRRRGELADSQARLNHTITKYQETRLALEALEEGAAS